MAGVRRGGYASDPGLPSALRSTRHQLPCPVSGDPQSRRPSDAVDHFRCIVVVGVTMQMSAECLTIPGADSLRKAILLKNSNQHIKIVLLV
jgi:hypothetical protein